MSSAKLCRCIGTLEGSCKFVSGYVSDVCTLGTICYFSVIQLYNIYSSSQNCILVFDILKKCPSQLAHTLADFRVPATSHQYKYWTWSCMKEYKHSSQNLKGNRWICRPPRPSLSGKRWRICGLGRSSSPTPCKAKPGTNSS
ncbi:hypothetical protein H5410_056828 [Solanum commersonii]|uniref:Uncharacterized protein n=1 Tax=Solanum commersonii TaxID=4109 RepID=A0A9J5WP64_SOLCO|nr:hypothetical protein H5410_056828 [Solanum commersonii]